MIMGERNRNSPMGPPARIGGRRRPITGSLPAPIVPGTPGYDENSHAPVIKMGSKRVNDIRHIIDMRKNRAEAPIAFGEDRGRGPHIGRYQPLNRNSRVALHTERTRLSDYSHRAKK
jgi:hypothetical protein